MPLPGSLLHGAREVGWHAKVCSEFVIAITVSEDSRKKVLDKESSGLLFFEEV